jgi:hypothetical protein
VCTFVAKVFLLGKLISARPDVLIYANKESAKDVPVYKVDPSWPKPLPNKRIQKFVPVNNQRTSAR